MVIGIGVDIVNISRFKRVLGQWDKRFTQKVFTSFEVSCSMDKGRREEFLAGRFAAKEAFIKALGGRCGLLWKDIEVYSHRSGRPLLRFDSSKLTPRFDVLKTHLSIAHDGNYAVAYCLLEGLRHEGG